MKLSKYEKFIKSYQYNKTTKSVEVLVDSVYQKNQKDLFPIGKLSDIRSLIRHLEEIRNFMIESENK